MLRQIASSVWVAEHELRTLGVWFQTRMTVVRLASGQLWVHSPIPVAGLEEQLDALGPVAFVVAPNLFHHTFVGPFAGRRAETRVYGAPGLAKKRPDLHFTAELSSEPPAEWNDEFEQELLGGSPDYSEVMFFHRASRTLILTDLLFNHHPVRNWASGMLFRIAGTYKRLAASRLLMTLVKDKTAARRSVARILSWDFERATVAHGEVMVDDAKLRVTDALRAVGLVEARGQKGV